jgi:N-methylhydantoinase A
MFKIGMDTGGTFTDLMIVEEGSEIRSLKTPSSPEDPFESVVAGLSRVAEGYKLDIKQLLSKVGLFIYGTTIVSNALITRSGVKTGLITTKGFEDIIYFRMGKKWGYTVYDYKITFPKPLVPGYLRIGVDERIRYNGEVVTPLDEGDVKAAVATFKKHGVESIAVCFLNSYENGFHEKRAAEICRAEFPEAYIVESSQVLPKIREWERFHTAVVSAYVGPLIQNYLGKMERFLTENKLKGSFLIMQANGGVQSVKETVRRAALTLNSGPSAGPSATLLYDRLLDLNKIVSIDMGGTSLDISLVVNKSIPTTTRQFIGDGRIAFKMIDCHNIGAGGGSIAGFDPMGLLKVGPESAGASPGPICYGKGGDQITVTDANLILGYIPVDNFLGGEMKLDYDTTARAMESLAKKMDMNIYEVAHAIYTVVNHNMASATLGFVVERGYDPRDFTLIVGGGAGPAHVAMVAEGCHIPRVIVPKFSSNYCSFGMLFTDIIHDYVRSYRVLTSQADLAKLNMFYEEMEREAMETLTAEGVEPGDCLLTRSAEMRYAGQYRELEVPIPGGKLTEDSIQKIEKTFHRRHEDVLLFSSKEGLPQIVYLAVKAVGRVWKPKLQEIPKGGGKAPQARSRQCFFEGKMMETAIYDGDKLLQDHVIPGPAIIEEKATTVVIPPGFSCRVDQYGGYNLEKTN